MRTIITAMIFVWSEFILFDSPFVFWQQGPPYAQ